MESFLKRKYRSEIVPALMKRFHYRNVMQAPKVEKIVVNVGVGEAASQNNIKYLETVMEEVALITGQKPVVTRARRAIANFKIRAGQPIGCRVTLRSDRMYHFMERLFGVALPRIRDFRGLSPRAFDGKGNYTLGIREQIIFPEIPYDKVQRIHGMDVTFSTTAETDEEGRELLTLLGMPFRKN